MQRGNVVPFTLPSGAEQRAVIPMVYPSYFATMAMPILAGRDFNEADLAQHAPLVAVVNEAFARTAFGNRTAVGQRLRFRSDEREIIGVVRDFHYMNLRGDAPPVVYQTFLQTNTGRGQMALYVRLNAGSAAVLPQIRAAVEDIDRTLPLFAVRTLTQEIDAVLMQERLIATLSTVFSTLALVLVCVGLYGLLSFSVVQRTMELGIRMALGATRVKVIWAVLREALLLVLLGVAIGVPAALALGGFASHRISGLFGGFTASDPLMIAVAAIALGLIAAGAAYMPARRASRVDPMLALRIE
jgi:hypothetical protein